MSIKELDDASKIYKRLLDGMADIDDKYSTDYVQQEVDAPKSLGLKKLTYSMPSEEEILQRAEGYYSADKQEDIEEVNASTTKGIQGLEQKAKSILDEATAGQIKINADRQSGLKETNYSTQKRNLTDSSIKSGMIDKLNFLADSALENLQQNTNDSLADIETQKNQLVEFAKQQLQNLEDIYSKKIAEKTEEIRQTAQKQADSVTKYNNSVDEKEAKYKKSLEEQLAELEQQEWQRVREMLQLTERIGASGVEQQKTAEKYDLVKGVLDTYPPDVALQILESSTAFRSHLGDRYDALRAHYANKRE